MYSNTLDIFFCWLLSRARSGQLLEGSALEGPFEAPYLQHHWRGFQSFWRIFSHCLVCASCWVFPFVQSSRRSLILSPSCRYKPTNLLTVSLGYSPSPKCSLSSRGSNYSWRDFSASAINVLGNFPPAFLFCRSFMKKVSWGLLPALQRSYFGGRLSSSLCRGGQN